jgi:asparagine synthase (glutamine-hydrolysing)
MTSVLSHRGPDGHGYYREQNVGLGHRRLAVIDLATGSQPMKSQGGHLVIVFNGEIYNYVELRDELKLLGYTFETSSDTEVILTAYTHWGFECQSKLNGMWAFAIWDARRRLLFLSRDRTGEKPLHYSVRDQSLVFGSEIKSLLASGYAYEPARHLMHLYLSLGYVPAPHTFYLGISKLLPGHFLIAKDGTVEERTYWDVPALADGEMRTDAGRVNEEFEHYLSDSVKIRMRSDVPFGAFLSGGLDSSSVVSVMSQLSQSPIQTFTIGFEEKAFDERETARVVAAHCRTNHHEQVAEPEAFDEALDRIVRQFDEPFGDASAIPVGMVSRLARQQVTVALTGDGGDEVLSGYTTYATERLIQRYRAVPGLARTAMLHAVNVGLLLARNDLRYQLNRLKRFMSLASTSFEQRLIGKFSLLDAESIRGLLPGDEPQLSIEDYIGDVFSRCALKDPLYRLMYFHLKVLLPDDMLTKVDRMSMAHSLETRVPFLDHRLVELMYTVDMKLKCPGGRLKNILKETYGMRLPATAMAAPKKAFRVPLREWFKQAQFEERLKRLELDDFGVDRRAVGRIVSANKSGAHDYGDFIWRLFVLKKWRTTLSVSRAA